MVVDKAGAASRKAIFMIDASKGFIKDGNKNRLRAMDIHRIVDVYNRRSEADPRYARLVKVEEIERHGFNLNIPRYIDSQDVEDIQDIEAHLRGGIPTHDVDNLGRYWAVCPGLRSALFTERRPGYVDLSIGKAELKAAIFEHAEFSAFTAGMQALFDEWRSAVVAHLKRLTPGFHPKELVATLGDDLLSHYEGKPLVDHYALYQHLMDYWFETMQDDAYLVSADGWKAETRRIVDAKGKDKGWTCDLVPKELVVARYYSAEAAALGALQSELEAAFAARTELEEEHGGEDGVFAELDKVNKGDVNKRLKELQGDPEATDEVAALEAWVEAADAQSAAKKAVREADAALDAKARARYAKLTADDTKSLVVDDKWLATLGARIHEEVDRIGQALTQRVSELVERYERPLPEATGYVEALQTKVYGHLRRMGFAWT